MFVFTLCSGHLCVAAAPARKHGWAVRAAPTDDAQTGAGNTVRMLRQTWDRPSNNMQWHQT